MATPEQRTAGEKYHDLIATLKAVLDMDNPDEAVVGDFLARMHSILSAGTETASPMSEALARSDEVTELVKQKGLAHLLLS